MNLLSFVVLANLLLPASPAILGDTEESPVAGEVSGVGCTPPGENSGSLKKASPDISATPAGCILNYTGEGVCSWYDFAKMIAEYSGNTSCEVLPCHSGEFPSKVRRPSYSVLDKTRIKQVFGLAIPHWTESLRRCLERMGKLKT